MKHESPLSPKQKYHVRTDPDTPSLSLATSAAAQLPYPHVHLASRNATPYIVSARALFTETWAAMRSVPHDAGFYIPPGSHFLCATCGEFRLKTKDGRVGPKVARTEANANLAYSRCAFAMTDLFFVLNGLTRAQIIGWPRPAPVVASNVLSADAAEMSSPRRRRPPRSMCGHLVAVPAEQAPVSAIEVMKSGGCPGTPWTISAFGGACIRRWDGAAVRRAVAEFAKSGGF